MRVMILAFAIVGASPLLTVLMLVFITLWILLINSVGSYGKDTVLGYWGSVLLALFTTPVTAFIIVAIIRTLHPPASSKA